MLLTPRLLEFPYIICKENSKFGLLSYIWYFFPNNLMVKTLFPIDRSLLLKKKIKLNILVLSGEGKLCVHSDFYIECCIFKNAK